MGFIILSIDSALIKGINKLSKIKLLPLLFRGLLAATIGVFMAQPAWLYLFKKEILLQKSLDNEQRKIQKSKELNELYKIRKATLLAEKKSQKETTEKYAEVAKARQNFLLETDGSGCTGKIGIKDIAIAKRNEYQKAGGEYLHLLSTVQPKNFNIEAELTATDDTIKK